MKIFTKTFLKRGLIVISLFFGFSQSYSQERGSLMEIDTTTKKLFSALKKYQYISIGGYIQPQFQVIQTKGAKSFNGGDFQPYSSNRFMLRRGRIRFDYARFDKNNMPNIHFVFQFDGTERGVVIRDFWGSFYENKYNLFYLTTGMFARPFGFEVNYSSSYREAPERGRMSQLLMKSERDLGAMITFEPRRKTNFLKHMKVDAGIFNGQGLSATADFDSKKDFISRFSIKPYNASNVILSGSLSLYLGGIVKETKQIYYVTESKEIKRFSLDSSINTISKVAPRKYYGADFQVKIPNSIGQTEFRAEYIRGIQTATQSSSESPPTILTSNGTALPLYIRNFDGAYFCFLQHLGSLKHQILVKYDWYDPNKDVKGLEIDKFFSGADVRFNTLGIGYIMYPNENLRIIFWYDMPKNEKTLLTDYTENLKDNNFTCRFHYRF